MSKLRLGIDFDGVIHDYREGWKDGTIYGNVMPGFFEWAAGAKDIFQLIIYSSRSKTSEGRTAMINWLGDQMRRHFYDEVSSWPVNLNDFEFASEKPALFLTIDDRCVRFNGDWSAEELLPEKLAVYRTWSQRLADKAEAVGTKNRKEAVSLAQMIEEWVGDGTADWKSGLARVIEHRLDRLYP